MGEALAAHATAQEESEQSGHPGKIVVPSLTHTTCSSRTSWTIADDGSLTARIYDVEPSQDGDWGEDTRIERVILTVAPDGAHTLTQLGGVTIENLDRACRVWRAVRNICERAPEPEDDGAESPEVVRIQRTWAD